jgi:hypothetical protein
VLPRFVKDSTRRLADEPSPGKVLRILKLGLYRCQSTRHHMSTAIS